MNLPNFLTLIVIAVSIYWKLSDKRPAEEKKKSYYDKNTVLTAAFSFLYFLLNYLSAKYFPIPPSDVDLLMSYSGVVIFYFGIILCVWARRTMGKYWGTPVQKMKSQDKLITNGPFEYSRNPIYAGLILVMLGYGLALQSWFTFLVIIPMFYFRYFAIEEEKLLYERFGKEYIKYRERVPRFF